MILYQSGLIKLDYDPAVDILFVEWPDFQVYTLSDVRMAINTLVETVRIYDIKKLLVDSSRTVIEVNEEEYRAVMADFARALMTTRLQKMARIMTSDPERESRVNAVKEEVKLSVAFQNFTDRAVAIEWLKSNDLVAT
jgi:hypothetical protein